MLIQKDDQLVCTCGNDIFITMGDNFGFTAVVCNECGCRAPLMETTLKAQKLLNAYGEDYCRIYGRIDDTIVGGSPVIVDYLLFTEFDTAIMVSAKDRLDSVRLAKQSAVDEQWYERAARLREEERIIERVLYRENKLLRL